ncbi:MAG: hypothetical protein IJ060_08235 [Oscillospiraceae bacterium]|nr:hypothetical protein [Oscillospiraceae bacterium]
MAHRNLQKTWAVAVTEWRKWLRNPRMMIALMLVIVARTLAVEPLKERTAESGLPMNLFEPMIAVGNSGMLVMLLPAVFLILMSDFPVLESNSLLYLSRTGKRAWFRGQILFAVMSIFTYLGGIFLLVTLSALGSTEPGFSWSEATRTFVARNPARADSFLAELLPSNLYNQLTLTQAICYTFSLLALYLFLLCMILLLFTMLKRRAIGVFAAYAVLLCGVITCAVRLKSMWMFPMANSIIWLHYTEILRKPVYPILNSYLYLGTLIFALLMTNRVMLRRMEFEQTEVLT